MWLDATSAVLPADATAEIPADTNDGFAQVHMYHCKAASF
jgi:hypothetical protein